MSRESNSDEQRLLRYFMEQTEKRFDKMDANSASLHTKLDSLNEFKIRSIISTRWISGIISTGFGIITLCVSVGTSIYLSKQERQAMLDVARTEKTLTTKKDGP